MKIFKLGIISFKSSGVKISISNNRISYQESGYTQGIFRWTNGDKANDLHNLHNPINMFINDFHNYEVFEHDNFIFILNLARNGLKKLKLSYANNPIIKNSINNYVNAINQCISEKETKKLKTETKNLKKEKLEEENEQENDQEKIQEKDPSKSLKDETKDESQEFDKNDIEKNSLYKKFKEIWNKRQVSIIVDTLKEIDEITKLSNSSETINKYDTIDDYILSVMNILDSKDKNVLNIIKEIFAGH